MNLQEIIARLKLKYKILSGKIYIIIEDGMRGYTPRPATKDEITEIKDREGNKKLKKMLKTYTKKKKCEEN